MMKTETQPVWAVAAVSYENGLEGLYVHDKRVSIQSVTAESLT